jgi:hypothetical protein
VGTFRYVKWKRLSGAVLTGYVVKEDKRFLYVKSDKQKSESEYDFAIPQYALNETPEAFELSQVAFNQDESK